MIQSNELRLRNWVLTPNGYYCVDSICNKGVDLGCSGGAYVSMDIGYHYEKLHPIPITPEILEKCGFENTRLLSLVWHNFAKRFAILVHGGPVGYELLYLHQLQNLYFALTGEELTIKL